MFKTQNSILLPLPLSQLLGTPDMKVQLNDTFIELKHVMHPFPAPILITDASANIVYVNPAWEMLTGYKLEEVEGKNPHIFKSDKTDKTIYKRMWKALLHGKTFTTESIIDKRKNGTEFCSNSLFFPIRNNENTILYVQLELDITNRKRLDELKREFLSTATHELKTPITTLKLLIQSQLRKLKMHKTAGLSLHELQLIDRELNRLVNIIDDLSDVSRIEANKLRMDLKSVNITRIIADVVKQMKTISNKHHLVFRFRKKIEVIADENRIKQVLINLIKNAFKYSYPASEIVIGLLVESGLCTISVMNRGVGIPKHKQLLLFKRFSQLQKDSTGFGLGLYISKKIIEKHKGKIWLHSIPDKTTTFYFTLRCI